MFEFLSSDLGIFLSAVTVIGILFGAFVWFYDVRRLIKRHAVKCPGEVLGGEVKKAVSELSADFSRYQGKTDVIQGVIANALTFQLRDATTPRLDLLLDNLRKNRISDKELHELSSLLTTVINEDPHIGFQTNAILLKAHVEAMIYDREKPHAQTV